MLNPVEHRVSIESKPKLFHYVYIKTGTRKHSLYYQVRDQKDCFYRRAS